MKRNLARVLWLSAALSLGIAGCGKNEAKQGDEAKETGQAVAGQQETLSAAEVSDQTNTPIATTESQENQADPKLYLANKAKDEAAPKADKPAPPAEPEPAAMMEKKRVPQGTISAGDRSSSMRNRGAGSGGIKGRSKMPRRAKRTNVGGKIGYAPRRRRPMPAKPSRPGPPIAGDDNGRNTERYTNYGTNPMVDTSRDHLSTFAADVDTASYAIARRKILSGNVPPRSAVRVEEFVNYFQYDYAASMFGQPFAVHMDAAPSPFTKGRHVLRIGVQAKKLSLRERKSAHLTFLVDVSGSMSSADKLGLAKRAMRVLVNNLKDGDTVSLVTYASGSRIVLAPTGLEKKADIFEAIENLRAGGSTAMGYGLSLAYAQAAKTLSEDSISRVIVLSDGDANVGRTSHKAILRSIAGKVKEGVTLSTVGFGMGNYKDTMMEQLANKGNGNYHYIDGLNEAKKVFQTQLGGTLEVVAKDVKLQVDFDKDVVKRYRLVGYENRDIADRDFRNDKVDAGEIGAGHSVTAIYEVELTRTDKPMATVRVRAKTPRGTVANETVHGFALTNLYENFEAAPRDFQFATAVMATAEILRKSEHARTWSHGQILAIAEKNAGDSPVRGEFVELLRRIAPLRAKLAIAR